MVASFTGRKCLVYSLGFAGFQVGTTGMLAFYMDALYGASLGGISEIATGAASANGARAFTSNAQD